jgi:tetraacyldisaccharide 4'-kinase
MPTLLKIVLYPFSLLYAGLMRVRNHLYDTGQRRSARFEVCVISVGNLNVGGTGKSPHVEYLIRLLKGDYQVATLSRGYGRRSRGVQLASAQSTADQLGDEPMQFHAKFGSEVLVAVGEERILALPEIMSQIPTPQVVLLDDALQHRKIRRDLDILLTDYAQPFYTDHVLPAGRLREGRRGAGRAEVVLVTKCPPDLAEATRTAIRQRVRRYARPETPVLFTSLRYLPPQPVFAGGLAPLPKLASPVVLFTGIANPGGLVDQVRQQAQLVRHFAFADHFRYTPAALAPVLTDLREAPSGTILLTTEKDMVKLRTPELETLLAGLPIFYLPIEVYFLAGQATFDALVLEKVAAWAPREP